MSDFIIYFFSFNVNIYIIYRQLRTTISEYESVLLTSDAENVQYEDQIKELTESKILASELYLHSSRNRLLKIILNNKRHQNATHRLAALHVCVNHWKTITHIVGRARLLLKKMRTGGVHRHLKETFRTWYLRSNEMQKASSLLLAFSSKYFIKNTIAVQRHYYFIWKIHASTLKKTKDILYNWIHGRENATVRVTHCS